MHLPLTLSIRARAALPCQILLGLGLLTASALTAPAHAQDGPTPPATPGEAKPEQADPKEGAEEAKSGDAEGGQGPKEGEAKAAKRKARKEAQAEKRAARQAKAEGRPLAPDAAAAQFLEDSLNVPPRWASNGTVRLVYAFKDVAEQGDFVLKGFDAAEAVAGGGRGRRSRRRAARQAAKGKGKNLRFELSASGRGALLLHKLPFEDDFKITLTVQVVRSTKRSDFVAFVGKGGARFGSQLVEKRGSKFVAKTKAPVVREAFEGGSVAKIELTGKDGVLTTKINGVAVATTKKLRGKLDGQFGIYLSDMVIQIHQLEIQGRVDARKAKLPKE